MQKVVLITGASRGIGAATARLLAREGCAIVVNYARDRDAADTLVRELCDLGAHAEAVQADVAEPSQVMALYAQVDARFGRLDALVNNAGVVDVAQRIDEQSVERWQRMFAINVMGTLLCAREAVRRMSTRHGGQGGVIVNLSSAAAVLGAPGQYVDYAAAKGAVDSFTVGLAREVAAEGVRVCAVRPGVIDTDIHASGGQPGRAQTMAPMIPMKRAGTAEEVAQGIVWLLSDHASYATGTILDLTGGR